MRSLYRLTAQTAKSALKPGVYSDGGGLYLRVAQGGSRSWAFIFFWHQRRREMGLGGTDSVSLARAREKAAAYRAMVADGVDPIAARNAERAIPTFGAVADEFIELRSAATKSDKSVARWKRCVGQGGYAEPIRGYRVDTVQVENVLAVLKPIWLEKPEAARGVRTYIENVLDLARARGWRKGSENPAALKGNLEHMLPKRPSGGHHAAMPYSDVGEFITSLRARDATSARALEFLILCASRSGEVRLATWSEFDLAAALWTIPAERMKAGKAHRVPLSPRAIELLNQFGVGAPDEFIFAGKKPGAPLSVMAFDMLMRRLGREETVHGFRSSFRDWAGDKTTFPREIAEMALAHAVGDSVERAYRRGDALAKRRALMEEWGAYLAGASEPADVPAVEAAARPASAAPRRRSIEVPGQVALFGGV